MTTSQKQRGKTADAEPWSTTRPPQNGPETGSGSPATPTRGGAAPRRGRPPKLIPLEEASKRAINDATLISALFENEKPRLLSKAEMAAFLGIGLRTFERRLIGKDAPSVPIGGQERYDPVEILAWLRKQRSDK